MCITKSFQSFKSDKYICLTFFYDRFCYFFAVTNKCNNTSASLCHSVYFGKFYVKSSIYSDTA